MKNRIVYIIIPLMLVFFGCKEEGRLDHIDDNAPAPPQVTDVTIRNTPGGAVLHYKVPSGNSLLYVQAVYEIQPGVQRETKASYYKDSLVLEGFGDTRTYDVKLYSVGKNEKRSEPIIKQVNPTTAPIHLATKRLIDTFGGVTVSIENPLKENLAIVLMGDTAHLGYQTLLQTFYTSKEKANFSYRGLDTIPYDFSVYLRDRWNNLSEVTEAKLIPWFEELIPKETWKVHYLTGDDISESTGPFTNLWDGSSNPGGWDNSVRWPGVKPLPRWFTIDLGVTIIMSRLIFWQRANYYSGNNVSEFELWGSTNPNPNGLYDDSWKPLKHVKVVKPSPGSTITADDNAFAAAGFEFELESDSFAANPFLPVRYIRLKVLNTSQGYQAASSECTAAEISFYGIRQK